LNHLDTKFLSRRSDIIVSSTLSITLTPMDDDRFKPKNFAKMDQEEITEYVDLRNEYRSRFVPRVGVPIPRYLKDVNGDPQDIDSDMSEEGDL